MNVPSIEHVIAARHYFGLDGGALAAFEVGSPLPSQEAENEFYCPFRISIRGTTSIRSSYGVDALQALLLALGYIRAELQVLDEGLGGGLQWFGGAADDLGIQIPDVRS